VEAPKQAVEVARVEETIYEKIDRIALEKGVSAEKIHHIVKKESAYNANAIGDKNYVCPRTGRIAPSHGLVQINECFWPEAGDKAYDPEFALTFLADHLKKGNCRLWATCLKEWW